MPEFGWATRHLIKQQRVARIDHRRDCGEMLMERLAQCHCGSLRAITSGEPLLVGICHCKACQRRTGAVAASVAGFAKAQVTIEGQTKVFDRHGQSGRKVRFYFCPNCGTSLYWEADAWPDFYILAVGAFADPNFPVRGRDREDPESARLVRSLASRRRSLLGTHNGRLALAAETNVRALCWLY